MKNWLLREMTSRAGVPLMIDNAYGPPLPNICFVPVTPAWDENMILTMSLSKIRLPGTRTGIVIARPDIIRAVVSMVTTSSLCPNNLGQALVTPYLEDGTLERVCRETPHAVLPRTGGIRPVPAAGTLRRIHPVARPQE